MCSGNVQAENNLEYQSEIKYMDASVIDILGEPQSDVENRKDVRQLL